MGILLKILDRLESFCLEWGKGIIVQITGTVLPVCCGLKKKKKKTVWTNCLGVLQVPFEKLGLT